tara:strand:- start:16951 stop:17808 length:858 start_codon:yes stop_codon:yes gene_type:complete
MKKLLIFKLFLIILLSNSAFAEQSLPKNIIIYGNDFTVKKNETFNNITVLGGNLDLEGTITNNVTVFGGDLTITRNAKINGAINIFGGKIITESGVQLPKNYNTTTLPDELKKLATSPKMLFSGITAYNLFKINLNITKHLLFLVLGMLCIWFFEKNIISMVAGVKKHPIKSFSFGLLAWILFIPILILLIISLLGIPLIPFLIIFYLVASIFGWTAISCFVGEKIIQKWSSSKKQYTAFIMGAIVLMVFSFIPILSMVITFIGSIFAMGTVFMTKFGQKHFLTY